jgi:hypothetical protein
MSDVDPNLDGPPWEEDLPERDENTDDMFGDPAPARPQAEIFSDALGDLKAEVEVQAEAVRIAHASALGKLDEVAAQAGASEGEAYTVLARKYRPRTFEDLIGQEAMVRTLTNAFATGRIAHAFMLTGVRGVGKTTTARLLARAQNNQSDTIDKPSLALSPNGMHDAAIMAGTHMDVQEMDAASQGQKGGGPHRSCGGFNPHRQTRQVGEEQQGQPGQLDAPAQTRLKAIGLTGLELGPLQLLHADQPCPPTGGQGAPCHRQQGERATEDHHRQ